MIEIQRSVLTGRYFITLRDMASDLYIACQLNLTKEEYRIILKQYNAIDTPLGYIFTNKEDANRAKDHLDSILLINNLSK